MRDTAEMVGRIRRHNIDETTGRAAMMSVNEVPWHGLGTIVAEAPTSAEAIIQAGLDWLVEQWALSAWNPAKPFDDVLLDVPNLANVRSDTRAVLGVVGPNYRPLQNRDAFAFMDEIVGEGGARWETAGSINGGRQVWMLARLPKEIQVAKGDQVVPYALLCNGHDGTMAVRALPTTVRVVCNNTLNLALNRGEKQGLTIRHSLSLKGRVAEARQKLGVILKRSEQFEQEAQTLAKVRVKTEHEAREFFEQLYPTRVKPTAEEPAEGSILDKILNQEEQDREVISTLLEGFYAESEKQASNNKRILEQLLENFHNKSNTLPGIEGSAWSLYNAVSEYTDHQANYRSADSRLSSAWFGRGDETKQQAWQMAMVMAQ